MPEEKTLIVAEVQLVKNLLSSMPLERMSPRATALLGVLLVVKATDQDPLKFIEAIVHIGSLDAKLLAEMFMALSPAKQGVQGQDGSEQAEHSA